MLKKLSHKNSISTSDELIRDGKKLNLYSFDS